VILKHSKIVINVQLQHTLLYYSVYIFVLYLFSQDSYVCKTVLGSMHDFNVFILLILKSLNFHITVLREAIP
jgi:hypothetical protein